MKRITKEIKAIADAHLKAKETGQFDNPVVHDREDVIRSLREGKTFSEVLDQIEIRFVSITSLAFDRILTHQTNAYRKGIYKGFNTLLNQ
jgi:hypothetical protein